MKIVIRDDKGNEEILFDNSYWVKLFTAFTIVGMFFGLWAFGIYGSLLLFLFMFLFNWDWNERIIFDKGIKSVIVEEKIVIGKEFKWKEAERIKFSDIKIYVIEHVYADLGGDVRYYNTELIIDKESPIKLPSEKDSIYAKDFATRLCKITGANGYYIDDKKNSTPLIEAT
jgi:hypothetical protein